MRPRGGHCRADTSSCAYGHMSLLMQVAHEPSCRSLVHIWWRHTCEPCSVSRAFGSIKENNLQPRKRYDLTSFQLNQGDSEHKLAQACQTLVIAQVLMQITRTSSLNLCTPKSYWSNKKSGCMILCSGDPNHLKSLCVLVCSSNTRSTLHLTTRYFSNFPALNL
jgi:hypothetical protein